MELKTKTTTRKWVEHKLKIEKPEENKQRGLYYNPNGDEVAFDIASKLFDKAKEILKLEKDDPISVFLEKRNDEILAIYEAR